MTYTTTSQLLTFEEFLEQHGDDPRYELANGEFVDMEPIGSHEAVAGKAASKILGDPKQPTFVVNRLAGRLYEQELFRLGEVVRSPLFPNLSFKLDDLMPRSR